MKQVIFYHEECHKIVDKKLFFLRPTISRIIDKSLDELCSIVKFYIEKSWIILAMTNRNTLKKCENDAGWYFISKRGQCRSIFLLK